MLATSSFCFLTAVVKACDVQEPVPGTGPSPPEFDPPERAKPSPPVPQDDPMRPLPPQQPEIPPNERYPLLSLFQTFMQPHVCLLADLTCIQIIHRHAFPGCTGPD